MLCPALRAQPDTEIRTAISRALPPIERSTSNFVSQRACVSCHHNILSILTFHLARERGFSNRSRPSDRC